MKMERAYSLLEVKAFDDEQRIIRGIATSPVPDRADDVVEPGGVKVASDIPLFLYHDSKKTVGRARFGAATAAGIPFEATIPKVAEAGLLRDRVDEAWQMVKYRLITGVSIGFRVLNDKVETLKSGGLRFLETEVLELSLVPIPMHQDATITQIRSLDSEHLAASGPPAVEKPPGASGKPTKPANRRFFFDPNKGKDMKTIQEQIAALEAARAAKAARMTEIMQKSVDEGRSTDEAESEEFDTLESEVKTADADLVRLRSLERMNAAAAKPVVKGQESQSRGPTIIVRHSDPDEKFRGQNYTRRVIAKAMAYLSQGELSASQIAEQRWGKTNPQLVELIKTGVAGGSSATGEWGAELVQADARYTGDFIAYLNSRTVYNQLPLREVPANITIKGQDGAATGYWVGQSAGIPVTTADFSSVSLTPLKVAAMAVVSNELLRDSSPAAESLVRDALVEAAAQRIDATFLSADAVSAGVSPAGLLNGLLGIGSTGADAEGVRDDLLLLYSGFLTAKNASGLYILMNPATAKHLQLMRNTLGTREFPDISQAGGTLEGDPVVTGDNVNASHMILLKPSDIYKIGDGGVQVSISNQATIEQDTAPQGESAGPTAASANLQSMFQTESTAIKVVRSMNFAKRRSSAVAYIDDAAYNSTTT